MIEHHEYVLVKFVCIRLFLISHNFMVLSLLPLATVEPSKLNTTECASAVCPRQR
jgi:hypothetical protein